MLFAGSLASAQVGIGTVTPHSSAALDVSSTTKGLLLPRMSTLQRNAIVSTATGLVVFDTTLNGFYGYNGSIWTQTVFSHTAWSLTGNAGTYATTNFIGTTDNNPLVFRAGNVQAMTIATNGQVTLSGANINAPRFYASRPNAGTRHPAFYAEVSNDATAAYPVNYITANIAAGRIRGNYSFAVDGSNARAGNSIAGISYEVSTSRMAFYAGGHPASINDSGLIRMSIGNTGNVGIGGESTAKLTVGSGDVYLNTIGSGVIMKSPDGNCWKVEVSNTGAMTSVLVACP